MKGNIVWSDYFQKETIGYVQKFSVTKFMSSKKLLIALEIHYIGHI